MEEIATTTNKWAAIFAVLLGAGFLRALLLPDVGINPTTALVTYIGFAFLGYSAAKDIE